MNIINEKNRHITKEKSILSINIKSIFLINSWNSNGIRSCLKSMKKKTKNIMIENKIKKYIAAKYLFFFAIVFNIWAKTKKPTSVLIIAVIAI